MNYDLKVSVIVPIYNAEKHLKKCIDSLVFQTYKNLEIVLINDGSSDKSGQICDEYAISFENIKVIHQKNQGPSITRNNGILSSTGYYIMFVDADDYIDREMVERLLYEAQNKSSDLVICGFVQNIYKNKRIHNKIIKNNDFFMANKNEIFNFSEKLFVDVNFNSVWAKLYRKSIMIENSIFFSNDMNMAEDTYFNTNYIKVANRISILSDCLYYYNRYDGETLINRYHPDKYEILNKAFENILEYYKMNEKCCCPEKIFYIYNLKLKDINSSFMELYHPNCKLDNRSKHEFVKKLINDNNTYIQNCIAKNFTQKILLCLYKTKKIKLILLFSKIFRSIKIYIGT